jgi:hypothetical protein
VWLSQALSFDPGSAEASWYSLSGSEAERNEFFEGTNGKRCDSNDLWEGIEYNFTLQAANAGSRKRADNALAGHVTAVTRGQAQLAEVLADAGAGRDPQI